MNSPTEAERRLASKIAAHESWAHTADRSARTAKARAAFDQKFLDAANGDPVRAANLRAAHYARMALASAKARRRVTVEPDEAAPGSRAP